MLRMERLKKGWSQRKLWKMSGVSQSYISKLENKRFKPSPTLRQIIALAKALEIDATLLATDLVIKEINSN